MAGTGTAHLRDPDDVLLRIEDLVVEFKTAGGIVHAVSGISLDVREGETLGLVGESGCGKSTTGRAIMQLPPPTSGQVLFEGTDLAAAQRPGAPGDPHPPPVHLPGPDLVAEPAPQGQGHRRRAAAHLEAGHRARSRRPA